MTRPRIKTPGTDHGGAIKDWKKHQGKKHKYRPCGNPPKRPDNIYLTFHVTEAKTHLEFGGKVRWTEVTQDTQNHGARIRHYDVQVRATNASGVPIDTEDGHARMRFHQKFDPTRIKITAAHIQTGTTARITLQQDHSLIVGDLVHVSEVKPTGYNGTFTVTATPASNSFEYNVGSSTLVDGTDFGRAWEDEDDHLQIHMPVVPRPKTWYWQARVRAIDKNDCASRWTDWNGGQPPILPWTGSDPEPDPPAHIVLTFNQLERSRHARSTAIVTFDEVQDFEIPGGDSQDDVLGYGVQLQRSVDGLTDWQTVRHHFKTSRDEKTDTQCVVRFHHVKGRYYYRARARTIDRFNRPGQYSTFTPAGTPSDVTPPVPQNVTASELVNRTSLEWEDPPDDHDATLLDEDVEYYQVQVASDASFTNVLREWKHRATAGEVSFASEHYKRRYWWRVRSVNESGYKSAWRTAGPVRPQPVRLGRIVQADKTVLPSQVDPDNSLGLPLAGSLSNLAKLEANIDPGFSWIDGEASDGLLTLDLVTGPTPTGSPTVHNTHAGVVFRRQDDNNFLSAVIANDATGSSTQNKVLINKYQGGALTQLATAAVTIEEETSYTLQVLLDDTAITTYVNGVVAATTTSSLFLTSTGIGVLQRRASGRDDGNTRYDHVTFVPADATIPTVDDDFDRAPTETGVTPPPAGSEFRGALGLTGLDGGTGGGVADGKFNFLLGLTQSTVTGGDPPPTGGGGLGVAASGQTWTDVGTWSIEVTDQPYGLFINAATLPFYYTEDSTAYTALSIPKAADPPKQMGRGGAATDPFSIYVDRPTLITARATCDVTNDTAGAGEGFNVRFFVIFEASGQGWSSNLAYGRQTNQYTGAGDNSNAGLNPRPQRMITTMHQEFVDPGTSSYVEVKFWWGYLQDGASGTANNIVLRNQKMEIMTSYAPDFQNTSTGVGPDSRWSPRKRPAWTKWGHNRINYRFKQPNAT